VNRVGGAAAKKAAWKLGSGEAGKIRRLGDWTI
jgi:hypothetical protein